MNFFYNFYSLNGSLKQHTKIYSGSYCCTAYVLFRRRLIQKLWPVVYFLFAFILEIEYVAWNNLFPKIRLQVKPVCIATTAGGLELSTLNFAVRILKLYAAFDVLYALFI